MSRLSLGMEVMLYDHFRFAIPLKGYISLFSETNNGVEVRLSESNAQKYPVGSTVWVDRHQLKPIMRGVPTDVNWEAEYKIQGQELKVFIDERASLAHDITTARAMRDVWKQSYYQARNVGFVLSAAVIILLCALTL